MRFLDQLVASVLAAAKWLALPIVVLLFLQWPLRSIIGLYSREQPLAEIIGFARIEADDRTQRPLQKQQNYDRQR